MKALSFLGYGNPKSDTISGYESTTYVLSDKECTTEYFPAFILRAFGNEISEMKLFVTEQVRNERLQGFINHLDSNEQKRITLVDIPNGSNEKELWRIFQAVIDAVDEQEEVVVDITHGFRSTPVLMMIAMQYLKVTKKIILKGLYYGAFAAEKKSRSPVFDMTPFVSLIDWSSALTVFNATGSSHGISELLTGIQSMHHKGAKTKIPPRKLSGFGKHINKISDELLHMKTRSAMHSISKLPDMVHETEKEIKEYAPPLYPLLSDVSNQLQGLGNKDKDTLNNKFILTQINEIYWYLDHGHLVHAAGLIREVLISYACLKLGEDNAFNYNKCRKHVDSFVGYLGREPKKRDNDLKKHMSPESAKKVIKWKAEVLNGPESEKWLELGKAYKKIADARNNMMHAEMSNKNLNINKLSGLITEISEKITAWLN